MRDPDWTDETTWTLPDYPSSNMIVWIDWAKRMEKAFKEVGVTFMHLSTSLHGTHWLPEGHWTMVGPISCNSSGQRRYLRRMARLAGRRWDNIKCW